MKQSLSALLVVAALAAAPVSALGHDGQKEKEKKTPAAKPVMIKQKLSVLEALAAELAAAKGRIDFHSKKSKTQLKLRVKLPISASLGLADLVTAGTAQIHVEFGRADTAGVVTPYEDCTLVFQAPDAEDAAEPADSFNFRLHAVGKKSGPKFVHGSCLNGLPAIRAGDSIAVYALVAGVRVDFMTK